MVGAIKSLSSKYIKVIILILCLGGFIFLLRWCWHEEYYSWYTPGPIQVLGNNNELWLFLEFSMQTHRSRRIPYWDVPSTYPIGGFQEVIILNENGLQKRNRLTTKDNKCGVHFHPNISTIFEYNGKIYLYTGPSMKYRESLFKFNENDKRFDLLPIKKGDIILNNICPSCLWHDRMREINQLSEPGSLRPYYRASHMGDSYFTWKGILFEITTREVNDDNFEAVINTVKPNKGYPIVLNYVIDARHITYTEYNNLSGWESGHPREKK